ncbi:MAG: helix-turn-helix transcriptional regulator [Clostridia bacterium]|nr:helix-turn-helix transcriptional regulator [Clostridia bacterium]
MNTKSQFSTADFCQNVRLLRERHGLSKRKMAAILHISVPTLEKLEAGILPHCVRTDILFYIHDAFGIEIDDMFFPLK